MRLKEAEVRAIRESVYELDPEAEVYLFGSRVDDTKKGGDIDLLVLSLALGSEDEGTLRVRLHERMGEQKIDIIIAKDTTKPFVRLALAGAQRL